MSLAVLGPITFEVSADRIRTWQEARRTGAARWAKLDIYGRKPLKEFLGPGLDTITLSVRLDIARGVVPRDELRQMRQQRDKGNVLQFSVGGELVGDFTLESIEEEWTRTNAAGVITVAQVHLQLEEYA